MIQRVSPDIPGLLQCLTEHGVEFVLVGSVAVQAWGVDVDTPGDLDIVPEASHANLSRLLEALKALHAESWPVTGGWCIDERGDREWENYSPDHPRYMTRLPEPDPADVASYDSMYSTRFGDFDIVPDLTGTYAELAPRSELLPVHGVRKVRVMSKEDLLARLTIPRRAKDADRVEALRAIQLRGRS